MSVRIEAVLVCAALALAACGGSDGDGSGGGDGEGSGASKDAGRDAKASARSDSGHGTAIGDDSADDSTEDSGPSSGDDDGGPASGDDAASPDDGGPGSGDDAATPPPASGCFPAVSSFTAAGTFTPTSADNATSQCTIFRPTTFAAGCVHPVIVWGNGTTNTPSSYTALFNHFASQGFIVAAADTSNAGSGKEMIACLEYVIAQNKASGSALAGHVDVNHIASSGYSQGGAGCLEAGIDPRFTVTAPVSPYVVLPLGGYDTTSVAKQVHPMFMISGSADTVAVPANNQQPIFAQAPVPIAWATHDGSTHFEVLGAGGAYAGPLTAWFRYQLMGDAKAKDTFEKPACTLCSAAGWTVQFNSKWK